MGLERLQAGEEGGDSGCAALWRDAYIFHNDYKNSPKNTACTTHCVVHWSVEKVAERHFFEFLIFYRPSSQRQTGISPVLGSTITG